MTILLILSLLANLLTLVRWLNAPEPLVGVLKSDVEVVLRPAKGGKVVLTLPEGLIVKNETPRGFDRISLLAPYRFSLHIADGESGLVDYSHQVTGDELYFTRRTETGK